MRATINPPATLSARYGSDKETVLRLALVALCQGKLKTIIDVRCYMARSSDGASPVYCTVWVDGDNVHTRGSGKAKGYGYHKNSAAMHAALDAAGVTLYDDAGGRYYINGVGESAMREAMLAIASAAGADLSLHCFA